MSDHAQAVDATRLINYRFMRKLVGIIAILLAPTVMLLSGVDELRSVSAAYWSDARDVFVGALVAVGFFLAAYNGSGRRTDPEYIASKAACVFVLLTAYFPTCGGVPPGWVATICDLMGVESKTVHYVAAVLFFVCLFIILFKFSGRARDKGALPRCWLYRVIAVAMVLGMAVLWLVLGDRPTKLFWIELWGLSSFGVGWILAGSYKTSTAQ